MALSPIAWSDVTSLPNAPAKLANVSIEAQTQILAYVNTDTPEPCNYDGENGTTTKLVRCLIAAHFGLVGPRWGFVSAEKEDDLEKDWVLPPIPTDAVFWCSTGYGMAYWNMRNTSLARLPWVL
jgi:hypothetical protein